MHKRVAVSRWVESRKDEVWRMIAMVWRKGAHWT